jgi:hypothetical protein
MRRAESWMGAAALCLIFGAYTAKAVDVPPVVCPSDPEKVADLPRSDVYRNVPFKPGELSVYEVSWAGLKAGEAALEVRPPRRHQNLWHRVFHGEAKTGDWFKAIFVMRDEIEAISRPDFAISKFFIEQDEGRMFGKRFVSKKWLDFDHNRCKVQERVQEAGKDEKHAEFDLMRGAVDALGVAFQLRAREFKKGSVERSLVYTSEKNWWLEAEPVAFEPLTVPAGTFQTVKLKLQTFLGKELQQKGDVWAWVGLDRPERPLVQIQGEIKVGSIFMRLHRYKAGS